MAPKLQDARRKQISADEPHAFRIYRHVNRDSIHSQNQRDQNLNVSSESAIGHSSLSHSINDIFTSHMSGNEYSSWLQSPELASSSFNAHDFLQSNISSKYDRASTRSSQIPLLDDAFDADAALAAIDNVESALRKQRHIARREEISARNDLRDALHASSKKREELIRSAELVSSHISTLEDLGSRAADNLRDDIATLKASSSELVDMRDARDLVMLLVTENTQLSAVHVSNLLGKANACISGGSLDKILTDVEIIDARNEISRLEGELKKSIESWMEEGVDTNNAMLVREGAIAARELRFSSQFIRKYISYAFSDNIEQIGQFQVMNSGSKNETDEISLKVLSNTSWDAANAVKEALPSIVDCFPAPAEALAYFMHVVIDKTVISVGDKLLNELYERITSSRDANTQKYAEDSSYRHGSISNYPDETEFSEIQENGLNEIETRNKQDFNPNPNRKKYLDSFVETLKTIAKLRKELFDLYGSHGGIDTQKEFSQLPDPFRAFTSRHISTYLETEKAWLNDQIGSAFSEISRIEAIAPRLAPRAGCPADVYHRYRVFFSGICSNFPDMTSNAVKSTQESIVRIISVMNTIFLIPTEKTPNDDYPPRESKTNTHALWIDQESHTEELEEKRSSQLSFHPSRSSISRTNLTMNRKRFSISQPSNMTDFKTILTEVLNYLITTYLTHAKTILEAAFYLLPVCNEDATMHNLWNAGGSPLTAYVTSVELLSQSNEILDKYVLTLECSSESQTEEKSSVSLNYYLDDCLCMDTREHLQGEMIAKLSDLGLQAQSGVRMAINFLKTRLSSIFKTSNPNESYCVLAMPQTTGQLYDSETSSRSSLDLVPSQPFIDVRSFIENQLQAVSTTTHGGNKEFIFSQLSYIIKEAVLQFWTSCDEAISETGASQLIADGKVIHQIFQAYGLSSDVVECLPAIGQIFLESADGLWGCVETRALASVDARTLVSLLRKRRDFGSEQIIKVCRSLGASTADLGTNSESYQEGPS